MVGSLPTLTSVTTVPSPRRPPGPRSGFRGWYENDLGWPTVPGSPVRLITGRAFDVLEVPREAGLAALEHLRAGAEAGAAERHGLRGDPTGGRAACEGRPARERAIAEECPGCEQPVREGGPARERAIAERCPGCEQPVREGGPARERSVCVGPVLVCGDRMGFLVAAGGAEEVPGILRWLEWGALPLDLVAVGAGGSVVAPLPPGAPRRGAVQGAAVWLRPPVPGREESSLPTMSAPGGNEGAPGLVRLVDTLATHTHRVRLRSASAQPLAFS
ncbi:SCO3374 family protein [Streptomyces niveiscabiei]|uniref:SCO3374 family protein n=1 Tax=Streptomyces niveiscabiei TaxID=164115 RepID=UPI00389ACBA7